MDFAGSPSERFADQSPEAQASEPVTDEALPAEPAPLSEQPTLPTLPALEGEQPTLPEPPAPPEDAGPGATVPLPPLPRATLPALLPTPARRMEPTQPTPAVSGSASVFRIDHERLAALEDLNWLRVRALLIALAVGVALGLLLLIPAVHAPPPAPPVNPQMHQPPGYHPLVPQKPLWASVLLVVGVVAPLLALAIGLLALPWLLWRAAWLRRQRDLHLAIGRQGLFFFLPGQMGRWFLLPWGHITGMTDATPPAEHERLARLRTVLWRRWARLRRLFQHGRRLNVEAAATLARSPFLMHARAARPRQRLRVICYARLPDSGYSWLFGLAPFTRRVGAATFLLETVWFEPAISAPGVSLQRVLLSLWAAPLSRAQRGVLPMPRARGAVLLNAPAPGDGPGTEARRVDGAAWAALPAIPALSVMLLVAARVLHQPLNAGMGLNLATLAVLTLGLGLLLAGVRWPRWGSVFVGGAVLLALAGALNLVYGLVALLEQWPWSIQTAPGEPLFSLEALAALLLIFGGGALALEGSGRPGERGASQDVGAEPSARPHSTELALALGLLTLGVARVLEDIDLAALHSGAVTLQWLRYTLAEPLLPLAIIGLSYFALLAGPTLQNLFRALQMLYGLALAVLAPAAFILVYRAGGGKHPVPLEWLPLLLVELICGALVVFFSFRARRREDEAIEDEP